MTARLWRAVALLPLAGCVYYNAMWSAERFARQARRAETHGQESEARSLWLRAATKAESVATRHPDSRWADDAVVLRAEALVRAGGCSQADVALARVRGVTEPVDLSERARLAAAECEVQATRYGAALTNLEPLLESDDAARRSRASYLAGRAAWGQGNGPRAAELLARSNHPAAPAMRARVLLASGQAPAGVALLDSLVTRRFVETEWSDLLAGAAQDASPAAASAVLDNLLRRGRVPPDAAARLLMADADRLAAAGDMSVAAARYTAAADIAPDAASRDAARVRQLRVSATEADDLEDLDGVANELSRLGGAGDHSFANLLARIRRSDTDAAAFHAAELARDSLRAPLLAAQLYRDIPIRWPQSVFAPKAIVAAIALEPDRADSLAAELDRSYPASPYTLAWHGQQAPGFAAAEDSLARALGFAMKDAQPDVVAGRTAAPGRGPRSVWLEPPLDVKGRTPEATGVPTPPRPGTPPPARRPAARPGDRPVDPDA